MQSVSTKTLHMQPKPYLINLGSGVSPSTDLPSGTVCQKCHQHYVRRICRRTPSSGHWRRISSHPSSDTESFRDFAAAYKSAALLTYALNKTCICENDFILKLSYISWNYAAGTLTFDALSYQAPHVIGAEVAPVRSLERVHLQWRHTSSVGCHIVTSLFPRYLRPNSTCLILLWICCATSCTTNPNSGVWA